MPFRLHKNIRVISFINRDTDISDLMLQRKIATAFVERKNLHAKPYQYNFMVVLGKYEILIWCLIGERIFFKYSSNIAYSKA